MIHSIVTCQRERDETKPTHDYLPRRRSSTATPGAALAEEKPLSEYLSILQSGDCGEAGATGGSDMKTITIQLPDVEAAMFYEMKKRNAELADIRKFLIRQIRLQYAKKSV